MKSNISAYTFIAILVVLNLVLAVYATPVTDFGDASSYIKLSKTFLGEVENANLQNRSPLYSIILAGFMLIFKAPPVFKAMIVFQYMLVAISAWLVYLLFRRLFQKKELAMLVALLFNLSFSTIFYANIIQTEILSVFLLVASIFLLLWVLDTSSFLWIISLGVALGLFSLARFNTIPLIIPFVLLLGYILLRQKVSFKKWFFSMGAFILSYAFIINLWCLYNYHQQGVYRLFPGVSVGMPLNPPLNITLASIRPGNKVSEANKPVLEIFLKAREVYLSRNTSVLKGSLSRLDKSGILDGLFSGYAIYNIASPELEAHYDLLKRTNKLKSAWDFGIFLREIAAQNKGFIWKYRFYSLLNSFRASCGGALPVGYGNINLNILPSLAFITFKFVFTFISVFVFIAFFFFLLSVVKAKFKPDITLLTMFFIVFSFWGINFLFYTVGDANRFKYPVDPLIIGLFVYYFYELIKWLKIKKIHKNET